MTKASTLVAPTLPAAAQPLGQTQKHPHRQVGLDLLRCVAILLVLGSHFPPCPEPLSKELHLFTTALRIGGWVGVDLFFVLSGFLVSGLLFKEWHNTGTILIGRFMVRRAFKIVPSLYFLAGVTVLMQLAHGDAFDWKGLAGELLFMQNYFYRLWNHTWSLAVEEHFYTLLALAAAFYLRVGWRWRKNHLLTVLLVAVCVLCLLARIYNSMLHPGFVEYIHFYKTHLRLDSLACGVLLACHWHRPGTSLPAWSMRASPWLVAAGCLGFLPFFFFARRDHWLVYTVGFTLVALASVALLLGVLMMKESRGRMLSGIAFLGRNSYGIYLWHLALPNWLPVSESNPNWWLITGIYWAGAFALGILSTRLIETPFLVLRNRYFQTRTA